MFGSDAQNGPTISHCQKVDETVTTMYSKYLMMAAVGEGCEDVPKHSTLFAIKKAKRCLTVLLRHVQAGTFI